MIGTERLLVNRERALEERLGLRVVALGLVERGQMGVGLASGAFNLDNSTYSFDPEFLIGA